MSEKQGRDSRGTLNTTDGVHPDPDKLRSLRNDYQLK